jgi:hypothetical protein
MFAKSKEQEKIPNKPLKRNIAQQIIELIRALIKRELIPCKKNNRRTNSYCLIVKKYALKNSILDPWQPQDFPVNTKDMHQSEKDCAKKYLNVVFFSAYVLVTFNRVSPAIL